MNEDARREWEALQADHERLYAELERLRLQTPQGNESGQEPFDWAAHAALRKRLAEHQEKITAWRERHLGGSADADAVL